MSTDLKNLEEDIENASAAEKRRAVASLPTSLRTGLGNPAYTVPKKELRALGLSTLSRLCRLRFVSAHRDITINSGEVPLSHENISG